MKGISKTISKVVEVEVEVEGREMFEHGWYPAAEPEDLADLLGAIITGDPTTASALAPRVFEDNRSIAVFDRVIAENRRRAA